MSFPSWSWTANAAYPVPIESRDKVVDLIVILLIFWSEVFVSNHAYAFMPVNLSINVTITEVSV